MSIVTAADDQCPVCLYLVSIKILNFFLAETLQLLPLLQNLLKFISDAKNFSASCYLRVILLSHHFNQQPMDIVKVSLLVNHAWGLLRSWKRNKTLFSLLNLVLRLGRMTGTQVLLFKVHFKELSNAIFLSGVRSFGTNILLLRRQEILR